MAGFRNRVLDIVRAVPHGKVVTYGQVALMAGSPRAARQVGAVLHGIRHSEHDVPWQRVINAAGGISTFKVGSGELQIALLTAEGVEFTKGDADGGMRVDLDVYRWRPDLEELD